MRHTLPRQTAMRILGFLAAILLMASTTAPLAAMRSDAAFAARDSGHGASVQLVHCPPFIPWFCH